MTPPIRVLLADDHEVVRTGFKRLLAAEQDIEVVAEAADGQDAYARFVEFDPDVVVMDLTMPGYSGFEAARRILARAPGARILVFSVHESETYLDRVLDLGILGYISKRSASRVIVDAVRCVARGEPYLGAEMRRLAERASPDSRAGPVDKLTAREFEIFCRIAEGKSVKEVAHSLNLSPKTASNHYTQIKRKLGLSNPAEFTLLAVREGLIHT